MVKFLKQGKVVILLSGKHAGKKAVIGTKARPYPHAVVAGIKAYPRPVKKSMTRKAITRRTQVGTFIKTVNYSHFFPTRYALDVDFKPIIPSSDALEAGKRKTTAGKIRKIFENRYRAGKNRWFFTKLKF